MKRYNAYKDSGVKWIGEIPSHWDTKQFRRFFLIKKDVANCLGYDVLSVTQKGLKVKDIESNEGQMANDYSKYQIVEVGDFVMNSMDLLTGYIDCAKQKGVTSPDYKSFKVRQAINLNKQYYLYIFQFCYKGRIFYNLGRGVSNKGRWRLPSENLNRFMLPVPPLHEQQAIVDYLKDKTFKIEQYVSARERERELLDSLKQSEIANVVTKGLNPNVKMKDSGIPWIGEIPEHWTLRRVKFIFTESKDKSVLGKEMPLSLGKETGIIPSSEKKNKTMESASFVGCKIVNKGDIVFNRFKARLFAISDYEGVVSSDYAVYKCKDSADPRYIVTLFGTQMYRTAFDRKASGVGDGFSRLYTDDLFSFYAIFPPLEEQQAIVAYIDEKLQKIDQYMSDLQREIDYLKEFKQRLISDAVTGQLCVTKQ